MTQKGHTIRQRHQTAFVILFMEAEQIEVVGLIRKFLMLCLYMPMLLPSLDFITASEKASCTISRSFEYLKMGCSAASMLSEKLSSQQGMLKTEVTHKSCFSSQLSPAPS